ncbi:MAG TPA: HAD family phosphatase [Bacteroidales bacterium]|nr:HAD family phosphatase [Bacteroidales bacterium]
MMPHPFLIKNFLFDLGGVILNVDVQKTIDAFRDIGIDHIEQIYDGLRQHHVFDRLETGEIDEEAFRDYLRKEAGSALDDGQINGAWNAMIRDIPEERIKLLKRLKFGFNLYLLSNTNEIHRRYYDQLVRKSFHRGGLGNYFNKDFYSHKIGYRKPDPEAFHYVIEQTGLQPAETFFVDDNAENIATAERLGFAVLHLTPDRSLVEELINY